jgi:hypothetical protein
MTKMRENGNCMSLLLRRARAEVCIVGDAGGGQANLNSGSTIVPKTEITYCGTEAPVCVVNGYTAETNNLNFPPTAPSSSPERRCCSSFAAKSSILIVSSERPRLPPRSPHY